MATAAAQKTGEAPGAAVDVKGQRELRIASKTERIAATFRESGIAFEMGEKDERSSLEASLDIALRITEAETDDQVFNPGETMSGQDLVGRAFVVTDVPVARQSDVEGGLPFYFQFPALVLNQASGELESTVVSVGALNVMTAMAALHKRGALVGRGLRMEASEKTSSGYTALWLKQAPEIAGLAAVAAAGDDTPY